MNKAFFIIIATLFLAGNGRSQQYYDVLNSVQTPSSTGGYIEINQDESITEVYNDHILALRSENGIMGWRIRLNSISTSRVPNAKELINKEKAKFLRRYPEIPTYLVYEAPDFRLYAGDFRTKSEAYKLWDEVKFIFPGAFPSPQKINLPDLNQNSDKIRNDGQD